MQATFLIRPIRGQTVSNSPMIPGGSSNIPYAAEQGINSPYQGIKVPCSAENRDNGALPRLVRSRLRR